MQPNDYLLNLPNPSADVMSGMGQALSLKAMMENQGMKQQEHQATLESEALRQQVYGDQISMLAQKQQMEYDKAEAAKKRTLQVGNMISYVSRNPNLSGDQLTEIFAQFPEVGKAMKKAVGTLEDVQKKDLFDTSVQIEQLITSGRKDKALELLDVKINAAKEANDEEKVASLAATKTAIDAAGDNAIGIAKLFQFSIIGKDKYTENIQKNAETQKIESDSMLSKAQANKANVEARVEAKKLIGGSAIELSKDGEVLVNESVATAMKSRMLGDQYLSVADEIDKNITSSGLTAKGSEALKKAWGSENAQTALRQKYTMLRNSAAVQMLPQGPATDKDIQMVLDGFPDANANPEVVSSFMRGMAKIQKFTADMEDEKADWVTKVGNLGSASQDIQIKGKVIPAGTRFTEYVSEKYGKTPSGTDDATKQANMPSVGEISKGYKFIGGNPANPESWEKI